MNELSKNSEFPQQRCLTYCALSYNGQGPAQSCVSILENFEPSFHKILVLPRVRHVVRGGINVRQTIPFLLRNLPWRTISKLGRTSLNRSFLEAINTTDPRNAVAYFWPGAPLSLVNRTRERGFLTVREMTNTFRGTAKRILDAGYDKLGLPAGHGITEESVQEEREELALFDYVFASHPLVEASLTEAGVEPARILPSSYGWLPSRFDSFKSDQTKERFRVLFVGSIGVGKGVPQLLAAWKKSGVDGELVLAGRVENAIKPLLDRHVADGSVRLVGFLSDLTSLYRSSDLFIFPSLTEGGPQVTYEAAGCGLPVITSPMGAGRIIRDGINGLVVEPDDIEGLAQAISQLASSREIRERFGRQAAVDAQQFTYEKIGRERSRLLRDLLNRPR